MNKEKNASGSANETWKATPKVEDIHSKRWWYYESKMVIDNVTF